MYISQMEQNYLLFIELDQREKMFKRNACSSDCIVNDEKVYYSSLSRFFSPTSYLVLFQNRSLLSLCPHLLSLFILRCWIESLRFA